MLVHTGRARTTVFAIAAVVLLLKGAAFSQTKSQAPPGPPSGARSRSAMVDKMRVHYTDSGRGGEALVFVHGWACDLTFWRFQTPAFAGMVRTIAVDLPGHGESDKPEVDYTQDLFARALHAVLRDAGVRRAVLVGHSMGTPVARQFYRHYPKMVRGLVIVDGALRPTAPKDVSDKEFAALEGPAYAAVIGGLFAKLIGTTMAPTLADQTLKAMLQTPKHVVISAGKGLSDESLYRTDPINVPVLALMAQSSAWPPDNEQFYRRVAPKIDYRVWEGTGHFMMIEKPDELNQAVLGFLRTIRFVKTPRVSKASASRPAPGRGGARPTRAARVAARPAAPAHGAV